MGWSGGTFTRVHDWTDDAGSAINIEASRMDAEDDNFEAGINACLHKAGQNAATGNLPMGGNRHTGVGNAAALTDYASAADVIDQHLSFYVDTGSADAYVITPSPAISAYAEGQRFVFRASAANTGATTLNVNGLGAIAVQKADGSALAGGEIITGGFYEVIYDANATPDRWVLMSPSSETVYTDDTQVAALYFNETTKRAEALATGVLSLYSDGNADNEVRSVYLKHSDGTTRGTMGHIAQDLRLNNLINSGTITLTANNSAGSGRLLFTSDPDGKATIKHAADNTVNFETNSYNAADSCSGAVVLGPDNNLRGVGFNLLPRAAVSGGNHTLAIGDQGKTLFYDEATERSIFFNNDGDIPVDAYGHIRCGVSSGTLTLDAGTGVTLTYWDGSAYVDHTAAANLEVTDGSYTWWKQSDTNYYIDGPNITTA